MNLTAFGLLVAYGVDSGAVMATSVLNDNSGIMTKMFWSQGGHTKRRLLIVTVHEGNFCNFAAKISNFNAILIIFHIFLSHMNNNVAKIQKPLLRIKFLSIFSPLASGQV